MEEALFWTTDVAAPAASYARTGKAAAAKVAADAVSKMRNAIRDALAGSNRMVVTSD
jgi:hypothetical protein